MLDTNLVISRLRRQKRGSTWAADGGSQTAGLKEKD